MAIRQKLRFTSESDLTKLVINGHTYYCAPHPDLPGYLGTTTGQIISLVHRYTGGSEQVRGTSEPKILKPVFQPSGYIKHLLCLPSGKRVQKYAHRFVSECFLMPPSPEMRQVNHINYEKADNHIRNLEYVTPSENKRHGWMRGAIDEESEAYRKSRLKLIKKA